MKSKYFNKVELVHTALAVRVAELLSQRTYVPNMMSKYFIFYFIAELLLNALVVEGAELL